MANTIVENKKALFDFIIEDQIEAVKNYYINVSQNNIQSFTYEILPNIYELDNNFWPK